MSAAEILSVKDDRYIDELDAVGGRLVLSMPTGRVYAPSPKLAKLKSWLASVLRMDSSEFYVSMRIQPHDPTRIAF